MRSGTVAGYPVQDVKVTLFDGQHHSVDSSEMAFKIAGSMAFKDAMENAQPTLMEPIMTVTVVVPEEYVGDVIGDLNSRRGRPLGMEPKGNVTEIKAEVPMAEMLDYATRPARDHRRAGRVLDGPRPLRGGAGPRGATGHAAGRAEKEAVRPDYPGCREEGASARSRRRQLRCLRAHHPQG